MKPATKAWLTTAGVVLAALFNFLSARADSNEAKVRAVVAYETMAASVKELQGSVHAMALEQAELRGQVKELEKLGKLTGLQPLVPMSSPKAFDAKAMVAPPPFEDAVRDYKAAKK